MNRGITKNADVFRQTREDMRLDLPVSYIEKPEMPIFDIHWTADSGRESDL